MRPKIVPTERLVTAVQTALSKNVRNLNNRPLDICRACFANDHANCRWSKCHCCGGIPNTPYNPTDPNRGSY